MNVLSVWFLLGVSFQATLQQNPSPCPSIFTYEPRGLELDRWYGRIILTTPEDLLGIWIRIRLDHRAELLGNWFGESSTKDNQEFVIKNQNYQLLPNREPLSVRFFIKYNETDPIPSVQFIRLNGRIICQRDQEVESTTIFFSSSGHRTSSSTNQPPRESEEFLGDASWAHRHRLATTTSTKNSQNTVACGVVKKRAQPLITHGQSTVAGDWPWHVAIYRHQNVDLRYICGGSLIAPQYVITAAHCVTHIKTGAASLPEYFVTYLGKHSLYQLGVDVQNLQVTEIFVHPSYDAMYFYNDIALLKLERAAEITDFVRPICLWGENVALESVENKLGTVVGWGFDENGVITENLMQAKMPVVNISTCIFSNRDFFSRFTSEKSYCAGYRNGTSACAGDSGGGMVFPKMTQKDGNTVWHLRGLVSLSSALQNEGVVCDTRNYVVFTDVAKHLDWIKNITRLL